MDARLDEIEKRHYRRYNFHGDYDGEGCEACAFIKEVKRLEAEAETKQHNMEKMNEDWGRYREALETLKYMFPSLVGQRVDEALKEGE